MSDDYLMKKQLENLSNVYLSVLTSLEREATERHDAQACGLALFVKDFVFVASVYFLCDILPPLAQLFNRLLRGKTSDTGY